MLVDDISKYELSNRGTDFCEAGTPLALNLICANFRALENFGVIEIDILKRAIDDAFEKLCVHWLTCRKCTEDDAILEADES